MGVPDADSTSSYLMYTGVFLTHDPVFITQTKALFVEVNMLTF